MRNSIFTIRAQHETVDARIALNNDMDRETVITLQRIFMQCTPMTRVFQHAHEQMLGGNEDMQLRIHSRLLGLDRRRYNRPTADEIGGIFIGSGQDQSRDIVLQLSASGHLMRVFESHQIHDALQYPLLHTHAEVGWTFGIPYATRRGQGLNENNNTIDEANHEGNEALAPRGQVTPREYAAYRMCTRDRDDSLIHRSGRLVQQYCVDQACTIEEQRLKYQREHQSQLRTDVYAGVMDSIGVMDTEQQPGAEHGGRTLNRTGTRIILAPSYPGSDRYMRAQYQDAMAIVRAMGKPDLFITGTCNPKWTEVTEALLLGQNVSDRPDLTARVFREKLKAILTDLSAGLLDLELARIHVINFQKRGLPHAHLLMILADTDKPRLASDYDRIVSAEIPDPSNERLHATIRTCMMHGPCGRANPTAPCMRDGACSKRFPKSFCNATHEAEEQWKDCYRARC